MTEEEFQEADVLWPDCNHHHRKPNTAHLKKSTSIIIPPEMGVTRPWAPGITDQDQDQEKNGTSDDEMIPPHILLARRVSEKMASSVCTGNGRTLKGRDLQRVRNAILKMTGFLER